MDILDSLFGRKKRIIFEHIKKLFNKPSQIQKNELVIFGTHIMICKALLEV